MREMNMTDQDRASASGTGPSQAEPKVSALRASVPDAGDIIIVEHSYVYDRHVVARVVKVGKVMWELEVRRRKEWAPAARQKVLSWLGVDKSSDPDSLVDQLRNANDRLVAGQRQVKDQYLERVRRIAQGMSTGTAKTAQPVEGEACQPGPSGCAQGDPA
jgi:hypothetical protein